MSARLKVKTYLEMLPGHRNPVFHTSTFFTIATFDEEVLNHPITNTILDMLKVPLESPTKFNLCA
jgi:hypothetical protein